MKRILAIIILLISVFLCACGKADSKPTMPDGVYSKGGKEYYVIMLPEGKTVWQCFNLSGNRTSRGTVVVNRYDTDGKSNAGVIYNSTVVGGGWVAYDETEKGKVIYIPDYFEEEIATLIIGSLARDPESYMTLEEAEKYIDSIG